MSKKRLILLATLFLLPPGGTLPVAAQQSVPNPPHAPSKVTVPAPAVLPDAPLAATRTLSPVAPLAPATPSQAQAPAAPPVVSYSFTGGNFLGVYTEELTRENMSRYGLREPRGVGVRRVVKDSPAERAGLRENDVIVRFDGEAVTSVRKLNRLIDESAPEHSARLTVSRNGAEQELSVTLGAEKNFPRRQAGEMGKLGEDLRRRVEEWGRDHEGMFSVNVGPRRRIGVSTTRLTDQLADFFGVERGRGVLITSVEENSAAAKAGLKAGDVLTEVEGEPITGSATLSRAINRKTEGEITLKVVRDKSARTIRVTPERAPAPKFELYTGEWPGAPLAIRLPEIRLPEITLPQITLPRIEINTPRIVVPRIKVRPAVLRDDSILL